MHHLFPLPSLISQTNSTNPYFTEDCGKNPFSNATRIEDYENEPNKLNNLIDRNLDGFDFEATCNVNRANEESINSWSFGTKERISLIYQHHHSHIYNNYYNHTNIKSLPHQNMDDSALKVWQNFYSPQTPSIDTTFNKSIHNLNNSHHRYQLPQNITKLHMSDFKGFNDHRVNLLDKCKSEFITANMGPITPKIGFKTIKKTKSTAIHKQAKSLSSADFLLSRAQKCSSLCGPGKPHLGE
ncbi:unnamed protein product [Gordionus sp. m RMFG-2023]